MKEENLPKVPYCMTEGLEKKMEADKLAQNKLAEALSNGNDDPKAIAKLVGAKNVLEVYQALDQLSIRKEFHAALVRANIDFDFIVNRLKKVCENEDDEVSIKGLTALLKSLGLEKYEATETGSKRRWEETIMEAAAKVVDTEQTPDGKYEVVIPPTPPDLVDKYAEAVEEGKKIYES